MLNNEDLRHLQRCELIISNEIKRICEANNIRYFMVAGTVLGTVRHSGFIPWDDDMDFGMERTEYERFCHVCETSLGSEFVLQTWDTDPDYPFSFGKVRLKNTKVKELFASSSATRENGIFVDVFPFDNAPDDLDKRKKQEKMYFFYRRALWIKKGYGKNVLTQGFKQKFKYYAFLLLCGFIPYRMLKKAFNRSIQKYNNENTKRLVFDAPYSYEKNCVDRELIIDLIDGDFEEYSFPMPSNYQSYLNHLYGDYMKLPTPNERHSHDILEVDFGSY